MKIIYVTLNNNEEAREIGNELLNKDLANCVNFFPITCIYKWEGKVTEEPEVVLIIKTKEEKYEEIEKIIKSHIDYTNFVGMIEIEKVRGEFKDWLNSIVK
ncbi:MAG: CutA1 divalent ion tolerance protein [candidate division WS6 bacterium GW2011_GWF2_39_15]|uniref:CutA1 divalent ion tolerance protein n=1 Tax=candidate division WS6 bacterium GW2011_GWF2_39_15 TaxID=1619100 RepID=A0A0G0MQT9_9BACT|nr:MAG: CutA1 divalent ion tolerance protein [candidate division WS6 bacterium GW2011_GWF2_39_15]